MLCFVVGLSPKEAARSLGIAEGTVRKQLGLARDELKSLVGEPQLPV
jgi:DNA-directed RNA polymerase specialized sigma24 family protein